MKTAGYAIFFARTLPSTLYSTRTSMADYLYNMGEEASLLPRDARYIARARTLDHRTRVATLSMAHFFFAQPCWKKSSASQMRFFGLASLEPVDWRGGQEVGGRREGDPAREARRGTSRQ